ncbi:molybdate ABC transporter substrate-binding protein [Phenylobacterium sp.]|uniref:molybdate ABC transporter substrate-binding protein n=1 Tax=Phenylobacterium sp. TaxID=1871053 RepID=UPI00391BA95A
MKSWLAALSLLLAVLAPGGARAADRPLVAAAADLQFTLPGIAAAFEKKTGRSVRLTFGASGALTQQILSGAPYEVFLSADESHVARLAAAGRTEGPGVLYGVGRIGIFAPKGSPIRADADLKGLAAALKAGRVQRFAIANPAHAPYGRAAQAALERAGLWTAIRPRLVLGENVSQATQFAASGAAQGGIIPLSLALAPPAKAAGTFVLLPADWHPPLRQRAVVLRGASPTARAFHAFLQEPEARAAFARNGFTLPAR